MSRIKRISRISGGLVAMAVLAAACSQGSAEGGSSTTSSSSTSSTSSSSSSPESASAGLSMSSSAPESSAAPSSSSSSAPSSSSTGGEPTAKTTVSYMDFSANGGHENDLDKIVAGFQKANPGITVKVENVAYADYFTKLQTAVAGGTAPDAYELNYENFVSYQSNGALADLSGVDAGLYRKTLLDSFAVDGKQYGLPESFSDVVLFYNKALFKKAGLALPTANWTWADEKAAATKLTDKNAGVWGDFQPITYNEFYKALAQSGGQFFNSDKTAATFNSPQGVEAAKWLVDKAGTVMPTVAQGSNTPDFDVNLFKKGKLAMWHTGIWEFSAMAEAPFDWDVVVEPGNTSKASAVFANTVVVNAASKNKAAAQKWLTYLTSSDTMVSTRLASSWELPPVADESKLTPYLKAGKPANRQAVFDALDKPVQAPVITSQQEMQDDVNNALTAAAAGRSPVDKALADAQDKVTQLLKQ